MLVFVFNGCKHKEDISNRVYFTFHPEDRKVIVPVQLNDSLNIKLMFDTGLGPAYDYMSIIIDSTVVTDYPNLFSDSESEASGVRSSWNPTYIQQAITYKKEQKLKIGNIDFNYNYVQVANWRKFMNNDFSDGIFNIPKSDTTHIWELNFENNYMEIHSANDFIMPSDCYITPLVGLESNPFMIDLPFQIEFLDHDTLTLNKRFLIDTGAGWDVVLFNGKIAELINSRDDASGWSF